MSKSEEPRRLHETALFVHGCLAALHLVGVAYNARRKNRVDVLAHSLALIYSVRSVLHHAGRCRDCEEEEAKKPV